ncbi:MAG: triose-phosphate isomerase [Deltaproteobacteria bacterium]|nr:triose-phosphate isomerase [Deltaproteobacteria bacterium]MCL4873674.1 triose-phosphate isomerase [bacterium]
MLPLIAGNWKMNMDIDQGAALVFRLRDLLRNVQAVEIVIAPPFTSLHHLNHLLADSGIKLAGQDLFWEKSGAYTGEISGEMLKSTGCKYVIVGHSERRQLFGETDETVRRKVVAALRHGLKPIVCVGETLDEREAGKTLSRVRTQVSGALSGLAGSAMKEVTIAYEPVWAIGTGKTAKSQEAEEVHNFIRELLHELFDRESVRNVRIIYGGSVKPDNIDELMAQPNIDGALVGGASLKAEDFARIAGFQRL